MSFFGALIGGVLGAAGSTRYVNNTPKQTGPCPWCGVRIWLTAPRSGQDWSCHACKKTIRFFWETSTTSKFHRVTDEMVEEEERSELKRLKEKYEAKDR